MSALVRALCFKNETKNNMFDLKVINSVLDQLEEERGIPREKVFEAIETALATAYKKEYGKRGQIIRAKFDINTGTTEFYQVKIVVDEDGIYEAEERDEEKEEEGLIRFNPEHHILLKAAKMIKKDSEIDEEITFPLEVKEEYGRIAAQTAKQVIIQKIREAEKVSILDTFEQKEGEIVHGTVQRIERGNIYVDLGRAAGIIPYDEQIPGERFRQGDRIRALLYSVDEGSRGVFLRLSRSNPIFIEKLFEMEVPELAAGTVEIKKVAREAGSRSKIAVRSIDEHIDPVGALVGQRGVRVSTVMSELGGEKIDIIEWSEYPEQFIEDSLSPAQVMNVVINEKEESAKVEVSNDQQSLAIGKSGQNVRLAAKLTGWKIDIHSVGGDEEDKKEEDVEEVVEEALEEATEETAVVEDNVVEEKKEEEDTKEETKE